MLLGSIGPPLDTGWHARMTDFWLACKQRRFFVVMFQVELGDLERHSISEIVQGQRTSINQVSQYLFVCTKW